MAFVSGITRSNYNTVGAQRLASAESQLNSAIKDNVDSSLLLTLQKKVDDIKNTINAREAQREKYLGKLSLTERRVQEAQFDEIKRKFDENNQLADARAEKTQSSLRKVSESVGKVVDNLADSVFHTLLGPLQLIVDPLEKVFNFNLFGLAKKPVGDFLESKFPSTYDNLKKNGGLIGAVGVAIIDAIHGKKVLNETGSSESGGLSKISEFFKGSGINAVSVLKTAGIAGLVVAGIVGVVNAWKKNWDTNGIEESQDLKKLLADENASAMKKILGVGKYALHSVFGIITGSLRNMWEGLQSTFTGIVDTWKDPNSSVFEKIWNSVRDGISGIVKTTLQAIGGLFSSLGDRVFGFFGENAQGWWLNFKDKMSETFTYIFDSVKNVFSLDTIAEKWEEFKESPILWLKNTISSITGFFNNIFSKIGQAFTGNNEFDFGSWITEKINDAVSAVKDFFVNIFEKAKNAITGWWSNSKVNPSNWFGGRQVQNVVDENGNIVVDANGNAVTKESTWWGRTWDWVTGKNRKVKQIDDAIISKDNDLYVPSPDDNIVVTKSDVSSQSSSANSQFQTELMNVLKDIANNLKQPTVINNMTSGTALNFEGMRL